jgi:hypothetical protein
MALFANAPHGRACAVSVANDPVLAVARVDEVPAPQ